VHYIQTYKQINNQANEEKKKIFRKVKFEKINNQVWPTDPPLEKKEYHRVFMFDKMPSELVSKVIVKLHPMIKENLVWKNHVILEDEKSGTKAWVKAFPLISRFNTIVRGEDKQKCGELVESFLNVVLSALENLPGVTMKQMIPSPHDSSAHIDLPLAVEERKKEPHLRNLVCTGTKLPICPEFLLESTSYLKDDGFPVQKSRVSSSFFLSVSFSLFNSITKT